MAWHGAVREWLRRTAGRVAAIVGAVLAPARWTSSTAATAYAGRSARRSFTRCSSSATCAHRSLGGPRARRPAHRARPVVESDRRGADTLPPGTGQVLGTVAVVRPGSA